ncbi:LytTR family DNA-binding domain-containing protein [Bacillus nitroreducens]
MIVEHNRVIIAFKDHIHLLPYDEILFIERFGDKTIFHTRDREILTNLPLKKIESELPQFFIRSHKSYIINKHLVQELKKATRDTYECLFENDKYALINKKNIEKLFRGGPF